MVDSVPGFLKEFMIIYFAGRRELERTGLLILTIKTLESFFDILRGASKLEKEFNNGK